MSKKTLLCSGSPIYEPTDYEKAISRAQRLRQVIPAGAYFTVAHGEYSDYETMTLCRARKNLDVGDMTEEYFEAHPEQKRDYEFKPFQFLAWMVAEGFADEQPFHELYLDESPRHGEFSELRPGKRDKTEW